MRGFLRLLTFFLGAQTALSQLQYRLEGVRHVGPDGRTTSFRQSGGFEAALLKASAKNGIGNTDAALAVVTEGVEHALADARLAEGQELLAGLLAAVIIVGIVAATTVSIVIITKVTDPDNNVDEASFEVEVEDGKASLNLRIKNKNLNPERTDLCDGCKLDVEAGDCVSGDCANYDKDATNNNIKATPSIIGDPHMVGLRGQKVDWAGTDNEWYCLISDGPELQLNVRVSAPMPQEFPDRQLVSAVSVLTRGGHSLVIEVKNPYSTVTEGCPDNHDAVPCLADGALRILVDGEDYDMLQAPVENAILPGGAIISATNLPAQCQPFGGDRIWAARYASMMSTHRRLRASAPRLEKWILEAGTLAAPTWCAKFVEEEGLAGLLGVQSSHAIFRVETEAVTLRINFGINYQDLVTAPDGITTLVPELEHWQVDLGVEWSHFSADVAGMLGDTSRLVLDENGSPVMQGLGALSGPVESYRVAGPLEEEFEQLHK